ncbi:MAG: hypothetical protein KC431_00280, partial [Myxococcales bacterium]|nr:hypothetical protein [Myxococcales bacterium]
LRRPGDPWRHVWLSAGLGDSTLVSNRSKELTSFFPLWLDSAGARRSNLDPALLGEAVGPEQAFDYVLAVLFSPDYRRRFAPLLARGYPRIPPPSPALLAALHPLGARLRRAILEPRAPSTVEAPEAYTIGAYQPLQRLQGSSPERRAAVVACITELAATAEAIDEALEDCGGWPRAGGDAIPPDHGQA